MAEANIAVLEAVSISNASSAVHSLDGIFSSDLTEYERKMCHWLTQVMGVFLDTADQDISLAGLNLTDHVTLVTSQHGLVDSKSPVLIIPSLLENAENSSKSSAAFSSGSRPNSLHPWPEICSGLVQLLFCLLRLTFKQDAKDPSLDIPIRTKYSKGFQRFVKLLDGATMESIVHGKLLLEAMLWGPQEEEIKPLSLAEDREQAFQVWLDLKRGKLINDLALGEIDKTLQTANMAWFLCSVTGRVLFDITKALYL